MEQIDIQNASDGTLPQTTTTSTSTTTTITEQDSNDTKANINVQKNSLMFEFLTDTDDENDANDPKDSDAFNSEQLKKDLLLKADGFFNHNALKFQSIQHVVLSSVPNNEDAERLFGDSNEIPKKFIAMDADGVRIPLEDIAGLKEELIALANGPVKQLNAAKPDYSKLDSLDMDSAEGIEKLLNLPPFDPQEPQVRFIIKRALSLNTISRSNDNVIQVFMPVKRVKEYVKSETFNPLMELLNTFAKHDSDEFCTFCSCKDCIAYREIAIHIMMEQFKASHMIVLLLDAIFTSYSPLLRNATAFNAFEKLLENNKDIYWIASGLIYSKKYEHLDLVYDESLTDPMKIVLFSSILMVNNPMQLLQIFSFHIKCIIKAFAVGICEIPAEEKLAYIIDGFDQLCIISEQVATYLFIFEKYFMNKFSLSWLCLCQRLFHQHVYMKYFVAITNSGESLKNDDPLKDYYFDFAKRIICTDMRWNRAIWPKLQRYNLSEVETKRRKCMLNIHHLFDAVVEDALRLPLEESFDDNLFYDVHSLKNRRLAWQNIMAFAKMKWPDGFFNAPNTLVLDYRCEKCGAINEQHESKCKCVTCSIGGDPFLPPSKMKNVCLDCLLKQRKINEESQQNTSESSTSAVNETDDEDLKDLLCGFVGSKRSSDRTKHLTPNISKMGFLERFFEGDISYLTPEDPYHISWATFKHLSQRERYIHGVVDEKYFCKNCNIPACMLARKLLNNEIAPELTAHLITYFHPLSLTKNELRALIPNIVFYNQRLSATENDSSFHNVVVKAYWTFIVSLYTTYFFDFETPTPLNLSAFVIDQSDIKLIPEKLTGNKEDTKFLEFLAAIRSFAPPDGVRDQSLVLEYLQTDDLKQQLENFLKSQEERRLKILSMWKVSKRTETAEAVNSKPSHSLEREDPSATPVTVQPTNSIPMPESSSLSSSESQQKKACSSKPKKCCLEHAVDLGADHCKDNHTGKKRVKKDCNHARINETRDRLRKKLQNTRKHQQQQQHQQPQHEQRQCQNNPQPQAEHQPSIQPRIKPKLQTPVGRSKIQQTSSTKGQGHPSVKFVLETASALISSGIVPDTHPKCKTRTGKNDIGENETLLPKTPPSVDEVKSSQSVGITDKQENPEKVIGKVTEICDMIDNNKLKMKKWIDETLTYIEGYASTSSPNAALNSNKKTQPQTKNPKKAAKKAKQKLRKEEEKRIGELHELRAQFQDIYFKEFVEKIELKSLKSNGISATTKRRCDKKKIADIEANIKKLQRAKAKLEGNILELIATVKQTNTEFKFPYLPTKEQQQDKLLEIENAKRPSKVEDSNSFKQRSSSSSASEPKTTIENGNTAENVFNYPPISSAKFFPNISFPYEMSFPGGVAAGQNSAGLGLTNTSSLLPQQRSEENPMCYAPPQHQLSPNVMVALGANENIKDKAASESCSDPSKRIVTIRRVHNPNLPDSQVTVTARGNSANEDKLLYTFINGQMVPTGGMPNVVQNPNQYYLKPTKPEKEKTQPAISKSKLKKERRRQARLELTQETASSDCECIEVVAECNQIVKAPEKQKVSKPKGKMSENKESHQVLQSLPPQQNSKNQNVVTEESQHSHKEKLSSKKLKNIKKSSEHNLVESKRQQHLKKSQSDEQSVMSASKLTQSKTAEKKPGKIEPTTSKTSSVPMVEVFSSFDKNKTIKEKEQRRQKLINHGQFDNNPYKTLHMDSDSELEVTASSSDEENTSDIGEVIEAMQCEEFSKTKSNFKLQNLTTQNIKTNKMVIHTIEQKKGNQHQKPSNTSISIESKSSCELAKDQQKPKCISTKKKPSVNKSSNRKDVGQQTSEEIRSKQKENINRNDVNKHQSKDQISIGCHSNDRKKVISDSVFNAKNKTLTANQNVTQHNNKSSTKSPTPKPLRNTKSNSSLNSDAPKSSGQESSSSKTSSKRSQRAKKKQDQQQQQQVSSSQSYFTDCGAGIPEHMEHFNPNEAKMFAQQPYITQQSHLDGITHQFQDLRINRDSSAPSNLVPSYASVSANKSSISGSPSSLSTVSIMDQLNRGVQVENLSLPPGITLTKVDPIKSAQLRQKSESIKRLSQPLQPNANNVPIMPIGFQHHASSTILAPPVASYIPAQYISSNSVPSLDQGNIIMVENISSKTSKSTNEAKTKESSSNVKGSSKSKRRRNKGKRIDDNALDGSRTNANVATGNEKQPKMVTLRNPMFHAGPASAAATILQQPGLIGNRHGFGGESGGNAYSNPLPMDQPAAIIKNENGMFTIRNPALHQAVTNGLALSGYRNFGGNVSYYTPQEAVAEAARAAQHHVLMQKARMQASSAGPTESFSYFSNNPTINVPMTTNMTGPKTVSASSTSPAKSSNKTSITRSNGNDKRNARANLERNGRLDNLTSSSMASRPSSVQRCISAIGSEVKNNRYSTNAELLWPEYTQQESLSRSHENLSNTSKSMVGSKVLSGNNKATSTTTTMLQDKYQQSSYYNGFEVFASQNKNSAHISTAHSTPAPTPALGHSTQTLRRSSNSVFDATISDTHMHHHSHHHMHHSCGDDSPPPTSLLGYSSSYLDDIPNTGVIRYDDASFLKNLIPGQRLNKEVSIHNINESNHGRNTSPMSHLVEITPVYSGNNKVGQSQDLQPNLLQRFPSASATYSTTTGYQKNYNEFADPNAFSNTGNNYLSLGKSNSNDVNLTGNVECESYKIFNYDFETPTSSSASRQRSISDLNNVFMGNYAAASHRASPFLDDTTMENFVQSLNALEIGKSASTKSTDQCSQQQQLNGDSGRNSAVLGNTSNSNSTNSTPAGWW